MIVSGRIGAETGLLCLPGGHSPPPALEATATTRLNRVDGVTLSTPPQAASLSHKGTPPTGQSLPWGCFWADLGTSIFQDVSQ